MKNKLNTLPIGDTISAAWHKIYGSKSSFWAAIIVSQLIMIGLMMVCGLSIKIFPPIGILAGIAAVCIIFLLQIGLYYMGIMRAGNATVNYKQLFYPFSKRIMLNTLMLLLLQSLIMIVPGIIALIATYLAAQNNGFIYLIAAILYITSLFAGLYLILGMLLAMGYVLTKNKGPIDALKTSYKVSQSHLFEMLIIYIIFAIINFVLSIPFGIGLIWGIPFSYILYGEIFMRLSSK